MRGLRVRVDVLFLEVSVLKLFVFQAIKFVQNEDGPTAVEYSVMLALIIVVSLVSIAVLGQKASATFNTVGRTMGGS
jgi:pilus assembly protein Flp/PilA